jgi:hypothetical protein
MRSEAETQRFSSRQVPVVLEQAELPDFIQIRFYDGFGMHCNMFVMTVV